MGQTKSLPLSSVVPITAGLCRLSSVPAGRWPFPALSPQSLYRCLVPYPVASIWCACSLLPKWQRPHLIPHKFGTPNDRRNATSTTGNISGLQTFRYVQAPILARPPGCTYRRKTKLTKQPGRLHHAMDVWLPYTNCGITTCPTRATDMVGLSPTGLRPCRPLPRDFTVPIAKCPGKWRA